MLRRASSLLSGRAPRGGSHVQKVRLERATRFRSHGQAGNVVEAPSGRDSGEGEDGLIHGELFTDAFSRARTEPDEGVARWELFGTPAVGVELVRIPIQ